MPEHLWRVERSATGASVEDFSYSKHVVVLAGQSRDETQDPLHPTTYLGNLHVGTYLPQAKEIIRLMIKIG